MARHQPDGSRTWMRYEALAAVTQEATTVRVVEGASVDWRHRKLTPDVIRVDDRGDVEALVEALQYDERVPDGALMQWPNLTFGFVAGDRRVLGEISYLQPGWLRYATWPGDRELTDPRRLEAWLAAHGWSSTTE